MVSVGPYAAYLRDASQTATIKVLNPNNATTTPRPVPGNLPGPYLQAMLFNPAWNPNVDLVTAAFTFGSPLYLPIPDLGDVIWDVEVLGSTTLYMDEIGSNTNHTVLMHPDLIYGTPPYIASVTQTGLQLTLTCGPTAMTEITDFGGYLGSLGYDTTFQGGKAAFMWKGTAVYPNEVLYLMAVQGCSRGPIYNLKTLFPGYRPFTMLAFRDSDYGLINLTNAGVGGTDYRVVLYRVNSDLTISFLDELGPGSFGSISGHPVTPWDYGWVSMSSTQIVVQGFFTTGSNNFAAWSVVTRSGDTISVGPPTDPSTTSGDFATQYPARIDDTHFYSSLNGVIYTGQVSGNTVTATGESYFDADAGTYPPRWRIDGPYFLGNFGADTATYNFNIPRSMWKIYTVSGTTITAATGAVGLPTVPDYDVRIAGHKANSGEQLLVGEYFGTYPYAIWPTVTRDSSGGGHDAAYRPGTPTQNPYGLWGVPGLVPGDFCFGGGTRYTGGALPGNWSDNFSIEFWYQYNNDTQGRSPVPFFTQHAGVTLSLDGAFGNRGAFGFSPGVHCIALERDGPSGLTDFYGTDGDYPADLLPHHVVVTYTRPSVDPQSVHFYLDGVEMSSSSLELRNDPDLGATPQPLSDSPLITRFEDFWVVTDGGNRPDFIDEFALYAKTLTSSTVANHYAAARQSFSNYTAAVLLDGPAVYYHLNERFAGAGGPRGSMTFSAQVGSLQVREPV